MASSTQSLHAYSSTGLRNIWLRNGFQERQTHYGRGTSYEDVDGLNQAIAEALCRHPANLNPDVLLFLRRGLGLTQQDLGAELGYSDQAIATWEKGRPIPPTASRLLRLLVLSRIRPKLQIKEAFAAAGHATTTSRKRMVFEFHPRTGWRLT